MAHIDLLIDEDGQTTIEVKGVSGPGCQNLTEAIEKAIGNKTSDVRTPEYRLAASQANQQRASR
jgi:hypothetical protein